MSAPCIAPECERPSHARQMCDGHYFRLKTRGVVDLSPLVHRGRAPRGSANPQWKEEPTYEAAHQRVRSLRGRASDHVCECGEQAAQWAYDHSDPNELVSSTRGCVYSTDPSRYTPMCALCHKRYDIAYRLVASS